MALYVLGIESTAHTFSCSVVVKGEGYSGRILSDVRSIYKPERGSGIHPREASRLHIEKGPGILRRAIDEAGTSIDDIDVIAYSAGPGLGPCLRVGAVMARAIAKYFDKPIVPVNHALGHIELGRLLTGARDPVVLLVSGGHTVITNLSMGRWRIFGETLDLTIGQLLDQFGRDAGLDSPAGPVIERLAEKGGELLDLPYVVKGNDVSFSGLLTAIKRMIGERRIEDLCYSIQEVAFAMLTEVTERALAFSEKAELLVVGGVAANRRLAEMLEIVAENQGARLLVMPLKYSGDCGAQIAWAGALVYESGGAVRVEDAVIRQAWRFDRVDVKWSF